MKKPNSKRQPWDSGTAAQSAHNPAFTVHGVNVVPIPPSFQTDASQRRRFGATQQNVPPPTGLPYAPGVLMRRPVAKRKRWWEKW